MDKVLLTALAAVTLLAIGMIAGQTKALPAASSSLVREAAIVCGGNGCNPVHTRAQKRSKFKPLEYTKPVGKAS